MRGPPSRRNSSLAGVPDLKALLRHIDRRKHHTANLVVTAQEPVPDRDVLASRVTADAGHQKRDPSAEQRLRTCRLGSKQRDSEDDADRGLERGLSCGFGVSAGAKHLRGDEDGGHADQAQGDQAQGDLGLASVVMLLEAAQLPFAMTGRTPACTSRRRPEPREKGCERCGATSELAQQTGVAAQTVISGERAPLSPQIEVVALRVTQEALANARRHARAR